MYELFTFVGKINRIGIISGQLWCILRLENLFILCYRTTEELFELDLDLPRVDHIFCDEAFTYDKMHVENVTRAKGAMTNGIKNLSHLRDKNRLSHQTH